MPKNISASFGGHFQDVLQVRRRQTQPLVPLKYVPTEWRAHFLQWAFAKGGTPTTPPPQGLTVPVL